MASPHNTLAPSPRSPHPSLNGHANPLHPITGLSPIPIEGLPRITDRRALNNDALMKKKAASDSPSPNSSKDSTTAVTQASTGHSPTSGSVNGATNGANGMPVLDTVPYTVYLRYVQI